MKKMFKRLILVALCCLMITPSPVLAATAKDNRAARMVVYDFFEAVNAYKPKEISKCFQPERYRKKFPLFSGKSLMKLMRDFHNDYLYYKIKKVTLKKNTGTVLARIRYCNLANVDEEVYKDINYDWYPYNKNASQKEIEAAYAWSYREAFEGVDSPEDCMAECNIKIPLIKRKGKWKIQKMTKAMEEFVSCNIMGNI